MGNIYLNLKAVLTRAGKKLGNSERNTYFFISVIIFSFFHYIWGFLSTVCVLQLAND